SGSKFCSHCSMALEPRTALKVEEIYRKADDLVALLLEEFTKRAPALLEQILVERGFGRKLVSPQKRGFQTNWMVRGRGFEPPNP
ncbi:MAG: hypothetical protein QW098_06955, partial [Candidatus Hadarchaeales archaeon]